MDIRTLYQPRQPSSVFRYLVILLSFSCPLLIAEADKAVEAYNKLLKMTLTDGKPPDAAVVAKVLKNLEADFAEYPEAFIKSGDFYAHIGEFSLAIRQYEEGVAIDSARKTEYQKRIIEVLIRQGKGPEAYQLDQAILRDHPDDPEARGLEASFLLDKGETDAALRELQSVIPSMPGNFVAHFNLGRAWFAKGDMDRAREQFEAALKLKPDYVPARQALTQLALRRGDTDAALRYSEETLQTDPNSSVSMLLEAAALLRKGEYDKSRTLLEKMIKEHPNQADALLELGVLDLVQKRFPEAEGSFRKAYAIDSSSLRGLLGVAETHFQQNEPDQAVEVVAEEFKKHPERAELQRELANADFRATRYTEALANYRAVLEHYRDAPLEQAELYSRIGTTYSSLGNREQAIENLLKAVQLAPLNAGYAATLAEFDELAGKQQEALASYRDALRLDPKNAVVMNNLAFLLTDPGGDLDVALGLAERAKQLLPELNDVSDTLGWIYLKKNMSDRAMEIFRDLTAKAPGNPTFHLHYATALAHNDDKAGALEELHVALENHPNPHDESEIRKLIQDLSH